jgi:hypothetical protein
MEGTLTISISSGMGTRCGSRRNKGQVRQSARKKADKKYGG